MLPCAQYYYFVVRHFFEAVASFASEIARKTVGFEWKGQGRLRTEGKTRILLREWKRSAPTFNGGVELLVAWARRCPRLTDSAWTIRLGKRTDNNSPEKLRSFVPLADLGDLVFGGWIFSRTTRIKPLQAGVLSNETSKR